MKQKVSRQALVFSREYDKIKEKREIAMTNELEQKLAKRCLLEAEVLALQTQAQAVAEALPEAKYELRQAGVARVEYGSGLRVFFDKLSGKREEKEDSLRRAEAAAQDKLSSLQRRQSSLQEQLRALEEALAPLREMGDTVELAQTLETEACRRALDREAAHCARVLTDLLGRLHESLSLAQEWARPNNRLEAVPGRTGALLMSQADDMARQCAGWMTRIAQCGILLELHPYFENPTGYISGVTQYARLDRINRALEAIREAKAQAAHLLKQLEKEESL